jgi:hypothetical protein
MDMKRTLLKVLTLIGAAAMLSIGSASAQVNVPIYANSGSYNGNLLSLTNGQEVGNELTLGGQLTSFAFEYNAPSVLAANVGVDVRFYLNNGAPDLGWLGNYPSPGTLFFDSGWFYNTVAGNIQSGPAPVTGDTAYNLTYSIATGDFTSLTLPGDFTMTVTWTNLTGSSQIQMPLANNTPGISTGNYWLNNGGTFELLTNTVPANFLVDFEVPEPSPLALTAIGGALLFGFNKLRRKS